MCALPIDKPVSTEEFAGAMKALEPFESKPVVAVALSGGIDSMALALLVHHWSRQRNGHLIALTVDHGLRPESGDEARAVQQYCQLLGIEHHILTWNPPALTSAIQAEARQARYRLLTEWCCTHHILHLITAHHQDDQAETLLFRLARGSGLDGLACMPAMSFSYSVRLLRPLLAFPKSRLLATLDHYQHSWVKDPSNDSLRYSRNLIRHHIQKEPAQCQKAAHLAARLGKIRNILENNTASCMTNCVSVLPSGFALLRPPYFNALPAEYGVRILSALIQTLTGAAYPLRTKQLNRLYQEISLGQIRHRRTLAGLQFVWYPERNYWLVCREPNALQDHIFLRPGEEAIWDQRFTVSCHSTADLRAGALGIKGFKAIEQVLPRETTAIVKAIGKLAFLSFPSFWHLEELIAVPHINYQHPDYRQISCLARFTPAKALAATAFFGMNTLA